MQIKSYGFQIALDRGSFDLKYLKLMCITFEKNIYYTHSHKKFKKGYCEARKLKHTLE